MTRAELVELLTVERFAPWRPPAAPARPERARPRRRARPAPPAPPSGPLLALDDPDVIERRRAELLHATEPEEAAG